MSVCHKAIVRLSMDFSNCDKPDFELLWIEIQAGSREVIVGALYHPPKPTYQPDKLVDYIERCHDILTQYSPTAMIIIITLNSDDTVSRTSMLSIVNQP